MSALVSLYVVGWHVLLASRRANAYLLGSSKHKVVGEAAGGKESLLHFAVRSHTIFFINKEMWS